MRNRFFQMSVALLFLLAGTAGSGDAGVALSERLELLSRRIRQGRAGAVTFGTAATLKAYLDDIETTEKGDRAYAERMNALVLDVLDKAENGEDAIAQKRGFLWRGYDSRFSDRHQIYSIYVPEGYDPDTPIPLVVSLHGGSSNHNVWLAMNLGNKIRVEDYWKSHRARFEPQLHPKEAIVVAPNGLGQIRWRWAGEQDIFDVIDDVRQNYTIDSDKIFLTGLSNGGIGSYTAGLKYAWRFAAVFPLSGITDWPMHNVSNLSLRPSERVVLDNESAITYAENAFNTHLRFYHGTRDTGFLVEQARVLADKLKRLQIPFQYHEYKELGHDLSHVLWRQMLIMRFVEKYTRRESPEEVRLVTATERAGRQFWAVLDDRLDHSLPARIKARTTQRTAIDVETRNVKRMTLLLDQCPVFSPIRVTVDRQELYKGPVPPNNRLTLERIDSEQGDDACGDTRESFETPDAGPDKNETDAKNSFGGKCVSHEWRRWNGSLPAPGKIKTARLSGPLGDANYEEQVHVFGTLVQEDIPILRRAANLGARGWVMARKYTEVRHPVVPDTELSDEMIKNRVVVLYGNAGNNRILAEIGDELPIEVGETYIGLRGTRYSASGVGARFICPNPLAPNRYLVVQAGVSAQAVEAGGHLPIYLADYIVYTPSTTKERAFMVLGPRSELETGFFTEDWRLPQKPGK